MQTLKFLGIILFCVFTAFACSEQSGDSKTKISGELRKFDKISSQPVSHAPWLRTVLPEKTIFYIRLPTLWGVLGQAKGNAFDNANDNLAYAKAIREIQAAIGENVMQHTDEELRVLWDLYYQHVTSPLEAVMALDMNPDQEGVGIVITAKVNFESLDEVNEYFTTHQAKPAKEPYQYSRRSLLKVIAPAKRDQAGIFTFGNVGVHYYFDPSQQRLLFYVGLPDSPSVNALNIFNNLKPSSNHAMYKMEQEIDASGQGLFAWMSPRYAVEFGQRTSFPGHEQMAMVVSSSNLKGMAAGIGVSNGKQRIKLIVNLPPSPFRAAFPSIEKSSVNLKAAGKLESVVLLNIPDSAYLNQILSLMPDFTRSSFNSVMHELKKEYGFDLHGLLDAIGPELAYLSDEAGGYSAVKLRDRDKFENILQQMVTKNNLLFEKREVQGRDFYHLKINYLSDTEINRMTAGTSVPFF